MHTRIEKEILDVGKLEAMNHTGPTIYSIIYIRASRCFSRTIFALMVKKVVWGRRTLTI